MNELIPDLYKSYGNYVNKSKMLPNNIDGLLPVQKRILLTVHLVAKNTFVKTSKILGECMARFHPHSEASGTVFWGVQNCFIDGDGQWGTKIGTDPIGPAAPRYTKVRANSEIEAVAFELINYVEWKEDELDPEPIIIPTPIPFCLISKYELRSIAFGYKTEIPCFKKEDLIKRFLFISGNAKKKFIPKPHIDGCDVVSSENECLELLETGKGKINIIGKYVIDENNQTISINGWNPRIAFSTLINKIDKYNDYNLLTNGEIGYIDQSTKNGTIVIFEVLRTRNKDDIFEKMKESIIESLKDNLTYNIIVTDINGNTIFSSVDEMIQNSYNFYKKTMINFLNTKINNLNLIIEEYKNILKIRPHVTDCFNFNNFDESVDYINSKTNLSKEGIKNILEKYKIKKIITVQLDIPKMQHEILEIKNNLSCIDAVVLDQYTNLFK